LQFSALEPRDARQLVINPLGATQVSNYSPQTFEDINLAPGGFASFTLDLHDVEAGDVFEFQATLHDFDEPLDDDTYWCCFTGQEVVVTVPPCDINPLPGTTLSIYDIGFTTYPNPVKDLVTLAFEKETPMALEMDLINMQGEKLSQQLIPEGSKRFSLSMKEALPAIYFIRLRDEQAKVVYQKILKL